MEETSSTCPSCLTWPGSSLVNKSYSAIIIGDGSSFLDKMSGHAALVISLAGGETSLERVCGAATHTDIGRAEFMSILHGLSVLHETLLPSATRRRKPKILILSDRQELVGSIRGIYARRVNRDLWHMLSFYEKYYELEAWHIKRDTIPLHKEADALASELRIVLKDFVDNQQNVKY